MPEGGHPHEQRGHSPRGPRLATRRSTLPAAAKTWGFTILKNKIIDVSRDRWSKNRVDLVGAAGDESDFAVLFEANDRWQRSEMPSAWGDPEQSLENQEFWLIFDL